MFSEWFRGTMTKEDGTIRIKLELSGGSGDWSGKTRGNCSALAKK